jgi:hypothetical protein
LDLLQTRFDHFDSVQHGLVHMVAAYKSCPCTACSSRKSHSQRVAGSIPPLATRP